MVVPNHKNCLVKHYLSPNYTFFLLYGEEYLWKRKETATNDNIQNTQKEKGRYCINSKKLNCIELFSNYNKAGYTATLAVWGWAGAVLEKVTNAFGQEQLAEIAQKGQKSNRLLKRHYGQLFLMPH